MKSFVRVGWWKTSFDLPLTAPPRCRIITSFMKPLEGTDSSDCFSNVHLCGQLGPGSRVWNSHSGNLGYLSLFGASRHIISVTTIFPVGIKPHFFFPPLSPFHFFSFPSILQIYKQTAWPSRVPQGRGFTANPDSLKMICSVFVSLLSPNWTLLPLWIHAHKRSHYSSHSLFVSRLSLPAGGNVRDRRPLSYNASSLTLTCARQRRGLILDPFHLLLSPS